MDILFENKDFIVCIKPRNILSQVGSSDNMIALLNSHFLEKGESAEAFPVHRLDRETSGVMVYAKNSETASRLSKSVAENRFHKRYYAVLTRRIDEPCASMRDLLFRDKAKNKSFVVDRRRNGVKEAHLEYKTVALSGNYCLVDVLLHTGRTHQIRVQFSSRGYPLYGDRKYGGSAGELALFAYRLDFPDPKTGEILSFCALPNLEESPWHLFGDELKKR